MYKLRKNVNSVGILYICRIHVLSKTKEQRKKKQGKGKNQIRT